MVEKLRSILLSGHALSCLFFQSLLLVFIATCLEAFYHHKIGLHMSYTNNQNAHKKIEIPSIRIKPYSERLIDSVTPGL